MSCELTLAEREELKSFFREINIIEHDKKGNDDRVTLKINNVKALAELLIKMKNISNKEEKEALINKLPEYIKKIDVEVISLPPFIN